VAEARKEETMKMVADFIGCKLEEEGCPKLT
jgi:hypothetical protein